MKRVAVQFPGVAWTASLALTVGCSWPMPGARPDDMSAEAHRVEAEEHARSEAEHMHRYDPEARARYGRPAPPWLYAPGARYGYRGTDLYWEVREYNPTEVHRDRAKLHEDLAREHAAAARVLEQFEEAECHAFPKETRALCPLVAQVESLEDVSGGVRVRLTRDANVNAAITHMRCHQAFARARGREGMDTCPLYMPGVAVERVDAAREVDLLALDSNEVEELRRRARAHLGMETRR